VAGTRQLLKALRRGKAGGERILPRTPSSSFIGLPWMSRVQGSAAGFRFLASRAGEERAEGHGPSARPLTNIPRQPDRNRRGSGGILPPGLLLQCPAFSPEKSGAGSPLASS
jgi:hypothetical protein